MPRSWNGDASAIWAIHPSLASFIRAGTGAGKSNPIPIGGHWEYQEVGWFEDLWGGVVLGFGRFGCLLVPRKFASMELQLLVLGIWDLICLVLGIWFLWSSISMYCALALI